MRSVAFGFGFRALLAVAALVLLPPAQAAEEGQLRTGAAAMTGWRDAAPGVRRLIRPGDMPAPYATPAAGNGPNEVKRPQGVLPQVPPGFAVAAFATGLDRPRALRTAPNGDVFVAESRPGRIAVLRAAPGVEKAEASHRFASGLNLPFGIAFYPPGPDPLWVYVAETDTVVRFPYRNGDLAPRGKPEVIVRHLPDEGGHWTRDLVFSPDGKTMYVSVGSDSNDAEGGMEAEAHRANILAFGPDGSGMRIFASGLRNPVGMAIHPATGALWTAVNERDGLGDNLPPDYVTHVEPGAFYGWPWYYIGDHPDPRHTGAHPELRSKVTTPDVLLEPHSAPLGIAVYTGSQFPDAYRGDIFVAFHGSWNRSVRTGYKLVRVRLDHGKATGEYEDFMTGFTLPNGDVWGRPVGVTVARDGALLMSDDVSGTVWRITHGGSGAASAR